MLLIAVFLIGTVYHAFVKVPTVSWVHFWGVYTAVVLAVTVIITVWLTIGGVYDLKQMLRLLARIKPNPLDDGMVIDHLNRDEHTAEPNPEIRHGWLDHEAEHFFGALRLRGTSDGHAP